MATSVPEPSREALVYCVVEPDGPAASFSCAIEAADAGSQVVLQANDGTPPVRVPFDRYLDLDALRAALRGAISPTLQALARATTMIAAVVMACAPIRRLVGEFVLITG